MRSKFCASGGTASSSVPPRGPRITTVRAFLSTDTTVTSASTVSPATAAFGWACAGEKATMAAKARGTSEIFMGYLSGFVRLGIRIAGHLLRLEASAQGKVQVDALDQALGLHSQERSARGGEREALLLHRAQVAYADAIALVGEFERAGVVFDQVLEDRFAIVERRAGRQRAFHFTEGTRADAAIVGDRLLLLGGADLDLRLQLAAEEERRGDRG